MATDFTPSDETRATPAPQLAVWTMAHGPDTVVAFSVDDAWAVWEAHCGEVRADYDDSDTWVPWKSRSLAMDVDGLVGSDLLHSALSGETFPRDSIVSVRASPEDWATSNGRGFLCSTEV